MFKLEVGQELEFIEPATADDLVIPTGTRVRVGAIVAEFLEPKVMLVVHDENLPKVLTVERHVVTMHCQQVPDPG